MTGIRDLMKSLGLAISCVCLALCLFPACAFADDAASADAEEAVNPLETEDNQIDTSQLPDNSFLYDTTIDTLANADTYYDGQSVQVTGEAVGEAINAGVEDKDHCWVTLTSTDDDRSSIVVYMSKDDAEKIDSYGSYSRVGSTVRVRGVFNLVCSDHDGESDIHADSVIIMSSGSDTPDTFEFGEFLPGLILVCAGFLLLLAYRLMRERAR